MAVFARQNVVTSHDFGPAVGALSWFFFSVMVLAIGARVLTKLSISRKLGFDDILIFCAAGLSIGQTVAVFIQTSNGLGQPQRQLIYPVLRRFQQAAYAADLLFIANICLTKLSMAAFLYSITPVTFHRRLILTLAVTIIIWGFSAEFTTAFQCYLPEPWKIVGNRCIDRTAFWTSFGVLNVITDIALIITPLFVIWNLQVARSRKIVVFSCFAARIVVIVSIITNIVYLRQEFHSTDITFEIWPAVLSAEITQNISIVTACIAYLKPFLSSLQSGMIRTDDLKRRGQDSTYTVATLTHSKATNNKTSTTLPRTKDRFKLTSRAQSRAQSRNDQDDIYPNPNLPFEGQTLKYTTGVVGGQEAKTYGDPDVESQSSASRMIRHTTTWAVDVGGD